MLGRIGGKGGGGSRQNLDELSNSRFKTIVQALNFVPIDLTIRVTKKITALEEEDTSFSNQTR